MRTSDSIERRKTYLYKVGDVRKKDGVGGASKSRANMRLLFY